MRPKTVTASILERSARTLRKTAPTPRWLEVRLMQGLAQSMRFCSVLTVFVVWTSYPAMAEDNVLGLPRPREARRPGAVLLHGGGPVSDEVFDRFVALAGGPRARIVL